MPSRRSTLLQKRARLAAMAARPAPASAKPQVAITDVRARAVREPAGGRTYILLSVDTSAGVTGLGETTGGDAKLLIERILEHKPLLIGQDALAAETVRRRLTQSSKGTPNELAPIQAAVNMALLDILGKISQAPVYQVLSGLTREKARAFSHLHGSNESELKASLERSRSLGFRAFLVPLRMPEGPMRGRSFYREIRRLMENLREAAGEDTDFILDCNGQLTTAEAAGIAAELERFHPLWIEEPTADINHKALSKISSESVTPLGLGRSFHANARFQDLLRMDSIDVLRPDISRLGISEIRKAAALAEVYYVAVAPFHRGGPIATAAALHAAASTPNFFIQEIPTPADDRDLQMRREIAGLELEKPQDGFLPLPTGHGLGVEVNEEAVKRYEVPL